MPNWREDLSGEPTTRVVLESWIGVLDDNFATPNRSSVSSMAIPSVENCDTLRISKAELRCRVIGNLNPPGRLILCSWIPSPGCAVLGVCTQRCCRLLRSPVEHFFPLEVYSRVPSWQVGLGWPLDLPPYLPSFFPPSSSSSSRYLAFIFTSDVLTTEIRHSSPPPALRANSTTSTQVLHLPLLARLTARRLPALTPRRRRCGCPAPQIRVTHRPAAAPQSQQQEESRSVYEPEWSSLRQCLFRLHRHVALGLLGHPADEAV